MKNNRPTPFESHRRKELRANEKARVNQPGHTAQQATQSGSSISEFAGEQIFGVQPVLETLRAGVRAIEKIFIAEGANDARVQKIYEAAREANIPLRRASREEINRLAREINQTHNFDAHQSNSELFNNQVNHQGVIALVAAARYANGEDLLNDLSARIGSDDEPLAIVLDGIEDPRNLGAIIRTAECAGAHGIFIPERRAAGLTSTVAKAAAGALEYMPVARVTNIVNTIDDLKQRGIWTIGTSGDARVEYTNFDWTVPCAIVLGGEGEGMRRLVRERCDAVVKLPLRGRIESLNVSVAAGVVLYEILRQRSLKRTMKDEAAYNQAREKEGER